jgi:hypothetical protein
MFFSIPVDSSIRWMNPATFNADLFDAASHSSLRYLEFGLVKMSA